jgi:hypothetical protein
MLKFLRADQERRKKVIEGAITSAALDRVTKTTDQYATEDMPNVLWLWNKTAADVERITGRSVPRLEQANAFSVKVPGMSAALEVAAVMPDISDDLRWRINWMRDFIFAATLDPKRIEHEATSARGWWWTKGRKTKIAMAAQDAKRQWDRDVELHADQKKERHRDYVRTLRSLNNKVLNGVRQAFGYRDFTSRGYVHQDPRTKWPGYKREEE